MAEALKPIQVEYKGYKFRSTLEARWAVFFDSLEIPWIYEPEGIDLGAGVWYLPDFYLPDSKQFFEVKGIMTDKDMTKIEKLEEKGYMVNIGYDDGVFEACAYLEEYTDWEGVHHDREILGHGFCDGDWLCRCYKCKKYFFLNTLGVFACPCCGYYDGDASAEWVYESSSSSNRDLWNIARQARFRPNEIAETEKKINKIIYERHLAEVW